MRTCLTDSIAAEIALVGLIYELPRRVYGIVILCEVMIRTSVSISKNGHEVVRIQYQKATEVMII